MAKEKKSRKNKQYKPKKVAKSSISETLPPGHRFDNEIANICSNILLRVQIRRLDKPISVERELRKEIKLIISQKKSSRVANDFFAGIINVCEKQPFTRAAIHILNVTHKEYLAVDSHMATFSDISMQQRIINLMDNLNENGWHIKLLDKQEEKSSNEPLNFFAIIKEWQEQCDINGRLLETISIAVKTIERENLTKAAYECGLILHRVASKEDYYLYKVHPDNNVPGATLSPPFVKTNQLN